MDSLRLLAVSLLVSLLPVAPGAARAAAAEPSAQGAAPPVPGDAKSGRTRMLEAGARALQGAAAPGALDIHLVGLHPLKDEPGHQMAAHHFCRQVNEDFAQCALFDGADASARLTGIEYIISAQLFESLPSAERAYWHPHNYEILSGQLQAPGLPDTAEMALMRSKMNSYGKTWHLWNTGAPGMQGDRLPMGDPRLAWSFNRDGEAAPTLLDDHLKRLRIDPEKIRRERESLRPLAKPQEGVDVLKERFGRETRELPGVTDRPAAAPGAEGRPAR